MKIFWRIAAVVCFMVATACFFGLTVISIETGKLLWLILPVWSAMGCLALWGVLYLFWELVKILIP